MKRTMILAGGLAAVFFIGLAQSHAVVRRPVDPGDIIAALRSARAEQTTGDTVAARRFLQNLASSLAQDPTPYNRWIVRHVNGILQAPVSEGRRQLAELLERLTVPLNPYDLRNRITELSRIAGTGAPDAAERCRAGLESYTRELAGDFSPTALWAQMRLKDLIAAASSQNTGQMETLFKAMLAEINY